jgi:hypothetical protein
MSNKLFYMINKEKLEVEKFWEEMAIENRTKLLQENNCWTGASAYFWQYLPSQIQTVVKEKFEKS